MTKSEIEDHILVAIVACLDGIGCDDKYFTTPPGRTRPAAIDDSLRERGITYRPSFWCDQPSSLGQARDFSRFAVGMESAGLIVRIGTTSRCEYLQPTAAGFEASTAAVWRRFKAVPDWQAVGRTLTLVEWSTDELQKKAAELARRYPEDAEYSDVPPKSKRKTSKRGSSMWSAK